MQHKAMWWDTVIKIDKEAVVVVAVQISKDNCLSDGEHLKVMFIISFLLRQKDNSVSR